MDGVEKWGRRGGYSPWYSTHLNATSSRLPPLLFSQRKRVTALRLQDCFHVNYSPVLMREDEGSKDSLNPHIVEDIGF